jgi:hypothetical protein
MTDKEQKPTKELVTLPDGRQGYRDKHGGIRNEKGEWMQRAPGAAPIFAGQRAVDCGRRRAAKAEQAARLAIAKSAENQGVGRSPIAAVGLLAGTWYDAALANAMDKPRESVIAGKAALQLAGMVDKGGSAAAPVDGLAVSGQGIVFLAELVARAVGQQGQVNDPGGLAGAPAQVIDGEAREVEEETP